VSGLELRLPPALLALLCAGVMLALDHWLAGAELEIPRRGLLAALVFGAGVAIAMLGVFEFRRARTTVDPRFPDRAAALVSGGIYRYTRNPMYLGMLLVLAALAIYLANGAAFTALPLFLIYLTRFQIVAEERAMQALFGEAFSAYRSRVRRWL
jgi:protein-S-isoprenylcysteine O-methyltransferase Ste14